MKKFLCIFLFLVFFQALHADLKTEALIKAKQIDEKILRNEDIGILSGVPITDGLVKSLHPHNGLKTNGIQDESA